jgi:O-antigen/teichoic acid export membrane protein
MKNQLYPLITQMREVLNTRTGRDTLLTFLGQALTATLGFCFNLILIRKLSVEDYGLFCLFLSACMFMCGFVHMGWLETYVRFGAKHFNTPLFYSLRKFILNRMLFGSFLVLGGIVFLTPFIADAIYKRHDFKTYLFIAVVFAFINNLLAFYQNEFRVKRLFQAFFGVQVGSAFLKLLLLALVLWAGFLNLKTIIGISVLVPLVFLAVAFVLLFPQNKKANIPLDAQTKQETCSYNHWILISIITVTIIGNIDSHIIAHYHSNQILADFGVAGRLTLPVQFFIVALTATLLPRLSAVRKTSEITYYLSRLKLFLIPGAFLLLLLCWLAPPALIWMAGEKYMHISLLIRLQICLVLLIFLTNPVGLVLFAWGWSKFFAVVNLVQMIIHLGLTLLWIPKYGAAGAISASLIVHLVGFLSIYGSVWYLLYYKKQTEHTIY